MKKCWSLDDVCLVPVSTLASLQTSGLPSSPSAAAPQRRLQPPAVSLQSSPPARSGSGSGLAVPVTLQPVLINRRTLGVMQPCPFTQVVPRRTVGPRAGPSGKDTVGRRVFAWRRQEPRRPVREGGFASIQWARSLLLAKISALHLSVPSLVCFQPCWVSLFMRKRPAAGEREGQRFPGEGGYGKWSSLPMGNGIYDTSG